jgi:hypothetical protein
MTSGYQVVLDACVLVNAALRDTLLRLAEPPHLYLPRWSEDIIFEMVRTLETKLNVTPAQTAHLVHELELHFLDAWVEDYAPLIPAMTKSSQRPPCAGSSGAHRRPDHRYLQSQGLP